MNKKRKIVFSDKSQGLEGDWPVAIVAEQDVKSGGLYSTIVDPVFNGAIQNNLLFTHDKR